MDSKAFISCICKSNVGQRPPCSQAWQMDGAWIFYQSGWFNNHRVGIKHPSPVALHLSLHHSSIQEILFNGAALVRATLKATLSSVRFVGSACVPRVLQIT